MSRLRPHIVILGAGFGGVYVAKKLCSLVKSAKIDLTIVNKTNYFLFTPLLHEVATGALSPTSVAEPLREIFVGTGVDLCQGTVESVDPANRRVHISSGGSRHTLIYDYLIIATGAETNFYDIPGAEQFSLPLKSLSDAVKIRARIIDAFEKSVVTEDPNERVKLLSFVVVGGGPTGVETVAELAEFAGGMVGRYYNANRKSRLEKPNVILVDAVGLLQQFSPSLRLAALERLVRDEVSVRFGLAVTSVSGNGLTLSNGVNIRAATVIWSAGVKPVIPHFEGTPTLVAGRLAVDEFFRLNVDERIFALGDVAGYSDPHEAKGESGDKPLPMLAQVAVKQAKIVAYNVVAALKRKKMKSFHYHSLGSLVSVGQWFALGEIFSLNIAGRLTWWLWRGVYLFKFASARKRVKIAFEWLIGTFYPRDVTKLT